MPATHQDLYAAAVRRCLDELDVNGMRKLHARMYPHLPSPGDNKLVLATMHRARTQRRDMPLRARAYSHTWLLAHGYPSGLPDMLKPKAERIYPRKVGATGFAPSFSSPILKPIKTHVEHDVGVVILDAYATDKVDRIDHRKLRSEMLAETARSIRRLVGIR